MLTFRQIQSEGAELEERAVADVASRTPGLQGAVPPPVEACVPGREVLGGGAEFTVGVAACPAVTGELDRAVVHGGDVRSASAQRDRVRDASTAREVFPDRRASRSA